MQSSYQIVIVPAIVKPGGIKIVKAASRDEMLRKSEILGDSFASQNFGKKREVFVFPLEKRHDVGLTRRYEI